MILTINSNYIPKQLSMNGFYIGREVCSLRNKMFSYM